LSKFALSTSAARFTSLLENETAMVMRANTAKIALLEARRNEKDLLYADDETLVQGSNNFITQLQGELDSMKPMVEKAGDPKLLELGQNLKKTADEYQKQFQAMVKTPIGQERMIAGLGVRKAAKGMESMLNEFLTVTGERIKKETVETRNYNNYIGNLSLILGVIIIAGGVLLAFLISRAITRPLNLMQGIITDVERTGDLSKRVNIDSSDEVGQTAKSFNELMGTLQSTFRQILSNVEKVSEAAQTLSSSSEKVANSSVHQSEAASAMAATVEEVTVTINHVSDSAREALAISRKSGELSTEGGNIIHDAATEMMQIADTVRKTSATIENLGQQSNQISTIVKVIKDIADQTNLLALNAAIEAARAGEQGRGFAVVADEVRKLAERTTKSTEEITHMIDTMQGSARTAVAGMAAAVNQVDGGVALAEQAGGAINQIREGAGQVINVVNEISSALVEQSSASNDIANHVERVAQMSEENSAAASETASATLNLKQLADAMREGVERFKI
jgi:methyl-accepting chemotaxis protein